MQVHERLLKEHPEYKTRIQEIERLTAKYAEVNGQAGLRAGVIMIPVVVHVVYNTADQNVSDAQINSQIAVLNEDYRRLNADASQTPTDFQSVAADARIEFQLAVRDPNCNPTTGITRTSTSVAVFTDDDKVKHASTGGHDAWPRDRYLNLWVCRLAVDPVTGQLLGYAQFPGLAANTDGVVIHYAAFGNTGTLLAHFDKGRTATHEIGHWLNLKHIWGDATCGDDLVSDTPVHNTYNTGCPTQPHYSTCAGTPREMTMNYMDYTYDTCMNIFTAGQSLRMDACLYGPRAPIVASDALIPPPSVAAPDLWSQDTPQDTGGEPNTLSSVMYESDDIWVRLQNDGATYQEHQNPQYGTPGPNYVYVRVRNRGCSAAQSGTVRLYWAKASTALGWPAPWDGSVTTPALMGGTIGSKATGSVNGGGFIILEFPWSPPNPADYSSFGADKSHFCLLSRIETSSSSPFGMTVAETSDLYANVKNNNNIVWKNVTVVGPGGSRVGCVTVGIITKRATVAKIVFAVRGEKKGSAESLFKWGKVEVTLGRRLFGLWKEGGSAGAGIQVSGTYGIRVLKPNAWIGNLKFRRGELDTVCVEFAPLERAGGFRVFRFDIVQHESRMIGRRSIDRVVGGQSFVVKTMAKGWKP
jgi:hypothetical protein